MKYLMGYNESRKLNWNDRLIQVLENLENYQLDQSVSVNISDDDFTGVGEVYLENNTLVLKSTDYDNLAIEYKDLLEFINSNYMETLIEKVVFRYDDLDEDKENDLIIDEITIDNGEFEDILGDENHVYFKAHENN